MPLPDAIRAAAAGVAARARFVRIAEDAIEPYAATLPAESPPAPDLEGAGLEERAAFSLTLNAINFGSGSAVALVERLAAWPTWRDVSPYDGAEVPFFKRAQIAAADLALAGIAPAADLAEL